jgi:DNA helicase-2/ATP-dependent DNA helicase PcrA
VLETALFNAGVPYRVYGGLRFFERAEIKHALAYLRLLENPRDDTSFLRVVNFPAARHRRAQHRAVAGSPRGHRLQRLHDAVSAVLGGRAAASVAAFVARIDVLREQVAGKTCARSSS